MTSKPPSGSDRYEHASEELHCWGWAIWLKGKVGGARKFSPPTDARRDQHNNAIYGSLRGGYDLCRSCRGCSRATTEGLSYAILLGRATAGQSSGLALLTGGDCLEISTFRVLVVDDYEPWRGFALRALRELPELQVVGESSDGLEAVQKAHALEPDLILLDIGLPTINGFEAARRILRDAPGTKILFVSQESFSDIVQEALRMGALGYVLKSRAATELLPAVKAVLQGKQFISAHSAVPAIGDIEHEHTANRRHRDAVAFIPVSNMDIARRHEVGFYSDDRRLLDDVTQFIGAALKAGNAAIVVATESHRNSLISRLQAHGVDIRAAIEQRRYIALDAADALSTIMVDHTLDPVRLMETFGALIEASTKAATSEHPRVAVFGEGTHLLWTEGNIDAAIQDEELCNELTKIYKVDFLCGFLVGTVQGAMDTDILQQICAQHSAVHSR